MSETIYAFFSEGMLNMTARQYWAVFFVGLALTTVMLLVLANLQASHGNLALAYATGALAFVVGMIGAIRGAQAMAGK
jgi:hypothetical protein